MYLHTHIENTFVKDKDAFEEDFNIPMMYKIKAITIKS